MSSQKFLSLKLYVASILHLVSDGIFIFYLSVLDRVSVDCFREKGTCQVFDSHCLSGRLAISVESGLFIYTFFNTIYAIFTILAHCCVSHWFFLRTILHHVYLNVLGISVSVICFGILISFDISITNLAGSGDFVRCQQSYNNLFNWNLAMILLLALAVIVHVVSFGFVYNFSRKENFASHFRRNYFKKFGNPINDEDALKVLPLIQESKSVGPPHLRLTTIPRTRLASTRIYPSSPILPVIIPSDFRFNKQHTKD